MNEQSEVDTLRLSAKCTHGQHDRKLCSYCAEINSVRAEAVAQTWQAAAHLMDGDEDSRRAYQNACIHHGSASWTDAENYWSGRFVRLASLLSAAPVAKRTLLELEEALFIPPDEQS